MCAALVAHNNTVRIGGRKIDLPRNPRGRSYAKAYVTIRHLLDGRYRVFHGSELTAEAARLHHSEERARVKRRQE